MHRVYNFSAGPAMLPQEILEQARDELLDWRGTGMSVMEISHRGNDFINHVLKPAEDNLRTLMQVPPNYKVLFISAGASSQFSMAPLNLLGNKTTADYINTGIWSQKAIAEARRYCTVNIAASSETNGFTAIPSPDQWQLNPNAAYVHYTSNETIHGIEFNWIPEVGEIPLVSDMSSNILSQPLDVSRYGIIYAGAQKNIGPSGFTIAIVREDLLGIALPVTPTLYNYKTYADNDSLYNTPATYSVYLAGLVFEWLKRQGGLSEMAERNQRKATKLYNVIDKNKGFYRNTVDKNCRSRMNVVFHLPSDELTQLFLKETAAAGMTCLKGHKTLGGIRASIYNPMPEAGVTKLAEFMQDFVQRNG